MTCVVSHLGRSGSAGAPAFVKNLALRHVTLERGLPILTHAKFFDVRSIEPIALQAL
jgi:hypothetical protein